MLHLFPDFYRKQIEKSEKFVVYVCVAPLNIGKSKGKK